MHIGLIKRNYAKNQGFPALTIYWKSFITSWERFGSLHYTNTTEKMHISSVPKSNQVRSLRLFYFEASTALWYIVHTTNDSYYNQNCIQEHNIKLLCLDSTNKVVLWHIDNVFAWFVHVIMSWYRFWTVLYPDHKNFHFRRSSSRVSHTHRKVWLTKL